MAERDRTKRLRKEGRDGLDGQSQDLRVGRVGLRSTPRKCRGGKHKKAQLVGKKDAAEKQVESITEKDQEPTRTGEKMVSC